MINNAIRVGYHNGAHDFFLRAENQTDRFFKGLDFTNLDTYFTKFIFDAIRRVDDLTVVGVEVHVFLFRLNSLKKASQKVHL